MNFAAKMPIKMVHLFFLISALLGALACQKSTDNSSSPAPTARAATDPAEVSGKPGDCKAFIKALPENYFHDWMTVPEDPSQPDGNKISIFYYGDKNSELPRVMFFNGGPGSDSHGNHSRIEKSLADQGLDHKVSMVFMDQRGTGCSSPFPEGNFDEVVERAIHYGSEGIVFDAEQIRIKLLGENKKWRIYGQSYGAFVLHRYAALYPKSIERAIAHAGVITPDPMERLVNRLYSQLRVKEMYLQTYPEDRAKFQILKKALSDQEFCLKEETYQEEYCGFQILIGLNSYLGFNRWKNLHADLNLLVHDDKVDLIELQKYLNDMAEPNDSLGTSISLSTIDYYDRNTISMNLENCSKAQELISKKFSIQADLTDFTECSSPLQFKSQGKVAKKVKAYLGERQSILNLGDFRKGLSEMTEKGFFLYSGEKDTFVPVESFKVEITAVGDLLNYTHFSNSGHDGFRSEPLVLKVLTAP